ncbi:MAG: aminotransferase class III-fold pyridoxal phosphate-dependent enzyme [Actinobacteria bacterium]|nr:aminotransferase class III-fold pyridoxal phosphate-dependent enzyme [Actinomycetota bacterium]
MPSWLSLYHQQPIALVRGEGCRVWDAEGNEYLDFFGGILTTISGHNVPEIVDAIREQAGRILHSSTAYLVEPAIELAERIADLAPVDDPKVFFLPSGTDAIEAALLITATYRRSNQVLAMRNSYHGRSFTAVAVTGNRGWSPTAFSPLSVSYVHGSYPFRSPWRDLPTDRYIAACVDDLRNVIDTQTAGDVGCMIAEPIQGVGGFAVPPDGLFGAFKSVLDEYGIPFISDEVQTGWGRTGDHFWGIDAHGVRPDALVFAKGVGNGLPLAGVVARAEIMDSVPANSISTFGGTHLTAAGGLANLRYLLDKDLQANAKQMGRRLIERLRLAAEDASHVGEVRGRGLMIGVEFVEPGSMDPAPEPATAAQERCRSLGVLVGKGGLYGNVLRIAPPLSVSADEIDRAASAIEQTLTA